MLSFALPPLTLEITDGDIAAQDTDAIVNAANNEFWMGAGVAGAIKARGGAEIEREAMAQGPVEPASASSRPRGRLPARYVIHAAVMGQDLVTSAAFIERATTQRAARRRRTGAAVDRVSGVRHRRRRIPSRRVRADHDRRDSRSRTGSRCSVRLVRLVLFGIQRTAHSRTRRGHPRARGSDTLSGRTRASAAGPTRGSAPTPMTAPSPNNASKSFVTPSGITKSATTSTTLRRSRTRSSTRCSTSSNASKPSIRISSRPTRRRSASPAGRSRDSPTVEHLVPMLSLDNAYNDDELRAFDERVRKGAGVGQAGVAYVAELKIDGLSIALTYENGRLVRGATRGDGVERRGRDDERPHDSGDSAVAARRPAGRLEVRGEVYLPRQSFERMNREQAEAGEPLYANPRNTAAGTMRNLDPALVAQRGVGRVRLPARARPRRESRVRDATRRRSRR